MFGFVFVFGFFCTNNVFSFCRFLQLFLQLLYCYNVLMFALLVADWPFCINKFDLTHKKHYWTDLMWRRKNRLNFRSRPPPDRHPEISWRILQHQAKSGIFQHSKNRCDLHENVTVDVFGTVYLLMSGLPRHSQHFVGSWKLIYFGNLTEIWFYNCVAIVVLEVTLT